jgi:hypothetical protein
LGQKGKLFIMLQTISFQILVNFGQRKSHQIELHSLCWFWNLKKRIVAACPGPRARGSAAVAWSPPSMPPPRAGGLSAAGHALDTGSHRPHVRHPPPEDAPILSSVRPKPFCFPLLTAEHHCQGHLHSLSPCRAALHNADELPIQAGCCRPRVPRIAAEQILLSPG